MNSFTYTLPSFAVGKRCICELRVEAGDKKQPQKYQRFKHIDTQETCFTRFCILLIANAHRKHDSILIRIA